MVNESSSHTYLAFISYKHEDETEAKLLQKKLESYRLPSKLCKRLPELPRKLNQLGEIARDDYSLLPGEMHKNLLIDFASSKYLIVICSKAAHDEPKYIDLEIELFLQAGHTYDQIIPLIIDNDPQPETNCFPPVLQHLNKEHEIIGVNIHDLNDEKGLIQRLSLSGRNQAYIKIIAKLLGILPPELQTAENRRHHRNLLVIFLCTILACVFLSIAGYFAYDYYVPKTAYYLDYVEEWGLPKGIGELTEDELVGMNAFYAITTQYHRVQELRHENAEKTLIDPTTTRHIHEFARRSYSYDQDGQLLKISCFNDVGDTVLVMQYSSKKIIDLKASDNTRSISPTSNLTAASTSTLTTANTFSSFSPINDGLNKSSIMRYCIDYDDQGRVIECRFAGDTWNTPASDGSNIWGIRYEYDAYGRITRLIYLSIIPGSTLDANHADNYMPSSNMRGIAEESYEYSDFDLISVSSRDIDGHLALNELKFAQQVMQYDTHHNCISIAFLDSDGASSIIANKYAEIRRKYDNLGNCTEESYLDASDSPAICSYGYSSISSKYNEYGQPARYDFFDAAGNPIQTEFGCAVANIEYDAQGKMSYYEILDAQGNISPNPSGYARVRIQNNTEEQYKRIDFLDENGLPTLIDDGYATSIEEYDDAGNETNSIFLDTDGKPIMTVYGFSRIAWAYNPKGQRIQASYFDENNEPILYADGYASVTLDVDDNGNLLRIRYYDTDHLLVKTNTGYSIMTRTYNDYGQLICEEYFDSNNNPVMSTWGYAKHVMAYDSHGNRNKEALYDTNGQPILIPDGFHEKRLEFDTRGNCLRASYFGTDGQPVLLPEGYHEVRCEYDSRDNRIKQSVFGTNGQPILMPEGHHEIRREYDSRDNLIKKSFYGVNGEPVIHSDGYACIILEYDENGNILESTKLDTNGLPILQYTDPPEDLLYDDRGFYYHAEYDEAGQWIRAEYFDAEGNRIIIPEGYSCITLEYDESGNRINEAYWGLDGRLTENASGYAIIRWSYNESGEVTYTTAYNAAGTRVLLLENSSGFDLRYDERGFYYHDTYDDKGNNISTSYYDADGHPTLIPDGYATVIREYDEDGNCIMEAYLDPDDNFTMHANGYAIVLVEYSDYALRERYYGPDQKPISCIYGPASVIGRFDERGNCIYEAYFDIDGKPVMHADGYASILREYNEADMLIHYTCFDASGEIIETK